MKKTAKNDSGIAQLRAQYPDGLHFAVGDTHGEWETLRSLMAKIRFDPKKDHVYFAGDYNGNLSGNVRQLLADIAAYYQPDLCVPGFHLIRGNHERELNPCFPLQNMPDIFVIRGKQLNYYITHAGMIGKVFELINRDLAEKPDQQVFAYRLDDRTVCYDAPFRQIIWSRRGLYSQKSHWRLWPGEEDLRQNHACIIHGHTPYSFFMGTGYHSGYGEQSLFWQNQHVFFSEDLQSFDIDSNAKGVYQNGETYRGLSCVCLEVLEEVAAQNGRRLTVDGLCEGQNCMFAAELVPNGAYDPQGDAEKVLCAAPEMKTITMDENREPVFA